MSLQVGRRIGRTTGPGLWGKTKKRRHRIRQKGK